MHSRFDRFRATPSGRQLEALIDSPERYIEFAALSRVGVAAIAAIADDIAERFPEIEADTTARQFCGAMVADVMRRHGHELVQARGRIGGSFFTYGAVFSPRPVELPFEKVIAALSVMPKTLTEFVSRFPAKQWTLRPAGTGFSLVEHVCHLRDLDVVFEQRIRAVRTTALPVIESVDGSALAEQQNYLEQNLSDAQEAFSRSRKRLCAALKKLEQEQLGRCGLRDGVRRMTLEELVRELLDHDRTHYAELDELEAELGPSTNFLQSKR